MRHTSGISKTEQVARWAMSNEQGVTADEVAAHFGIHVTDAKRKLQDIYRSGRYTSEKHYRMVRKGPRNYRVLVLRVTHIGEDPKTAVPVIGVSRDKKGNVTSVRRFRSAYAAAEEGFDHSSVILAAQGKRIDHMHGGFAWRYACDDKHALATITHVSTHKFFSMSFKGVNLKGLQLAHEIKEK